MVTKEEFLQEFNGHGNAYASFQVMNVSLDDLIGALNRLRPNGCFGSGKVDDKSIYFEGCKELPDELLPELTEELHCRGFADIGSWYGEPYFIACENGYEYDDYTAEFEEGFPSPYDPDSFEEENDCDEWDVFVTVTDNLTGATFNTGEGCVDTETKKMFEDIVSKH